MLLLPRAVPAQERPKLPRDADPNDWEAYYDLGVSRLELDQSSEQAFLWANRLDPSRAEPLYGRWISFWSKDIPRFGKYEDDDEEVLRDPEVVKADALHKLAVQRNPFVHRGLLMVLFDRLYKPGSYSVATHGFVAYGRADLPLALELFAKAVQKDEAKYGYLRFLRASAFVNLARYDSAAAEIDRLIAQLRAKDERVLGQGYESKELLEYAAGLLAAQRGDGKAAYDAFGRSLVENPAFAPAHAHLARMALARRDTATALLEYGSAVELASDDPVLRIGYGDALLVAGRTARSVEQLREAVRLAPYYAEGYYHLATALRAAGERAGAAETYRAFLAHATRQDARRAEAEQAAAALSAP